LAREDYLKTGKKENKDKNATTSLYHITIEGGTRRTAQHRRSLAIDEEKINEQKHVPRVDYSTEGTGKIYM